MTTSPVVWSNVTVSARPTEARIVARSSVGAAASFSLTVARCGLGITGMAGATGVSANGMASKPEMSTSDTSFAVLKASPADGTQPFWVAR